MRGQLPSGGLLAILRLSAVALSPGILILSRVVLGLAIGLASTNVPVYLSEVAPAHARGWIVSLFQLAVTVGIVVAYLTDYAFADVEGWRWMLGLAVVTAVVFGTGMFFLPETPRWLIRGGHHEVAHRVLVRIRELADVTVEIEEIKASLAQQSESGHWTDLLSRRVRPALVVGLGLAIFQQVTGINTVIYYAPRILQTRFCYTRSLPWRPDCLPIISFRKPRDALWNRSKRSGEPAAPLGGWPGGFSSLTARDCAVR